MKMHTHKVNLKGNSLFLLDMVKRSHYGCVFVWGAFLLMLKFPLHIQRWGKAFTGGRFSQTQCDEKWSVYKVRIQNVTWPILFITSLNMKFSGCFFLQRKWVKPLPLCSVAQGQEQKLSWPHARLDQSGSNIQPPNHDWTTRIPCTSHTFVLHYSFDIARKTAKSLSQPLEFLLRQYIRFAF